jgi:hypothetical protein
MADLNALIAQGAQFKAPPDPFEQYGRMQQLTQGQQTNQLNMMQMQEYQRKAESLNKLRSTPAPEGVNPDYWAADPEKALTLRTADVEGKTKSVKLLADKLALLPEAYRMADTPEAYLALHQSVHSDPVIGPWLKSIGATSEKGMATFQEAVQTGKFNDLRMKSMQSVSQLLESMKPQVVGAGSSVYSPQTGTFTTAPERTDTDLIRNFNAAKAQGFTGNLLEYQKQIAQAGRSPAAAPAPQPPVAVVDPVTGKQVYVSREEALRGRMTPAAAMESLPPKEIQKREAAFPAATSSVKNFEVKSDIFLRDLKALRDHPGLGQITGPIFGRTGSVSKEGSAAQALYDKVMAKGGFQALQDMRDASKTGGALGNVSNQEGKQLQASFAAIDRRQAAEDVQDAIDQSIADIEGSKVRMREAYDDTYSYKSKAPSKPEAGGATGGWDGKPAPAKNIDALLEKYK